MKRILSLLVLALLESAMICTTTAADGKWVQLFDGKSLDGWELKGGTAKYEVKEGAIVGTTVDGSKNTFLSKGPFSDFILEFDVKCDVELNSGVQIRSHVYEQDTPQASQPKRIREKGEVYGYQCEITTQAKGMSGNFWDEGRWTKWHDDFASKPEAAKAFKDGEWNHYRIVAQGDRIRSWVNGVPCADFKDSMDASGFIGLQVHSIKKGAGPYQVRWKNLWLRELKQGENADTLKPPGK
jgi:hypothetical protein